MDTRQSALFASWPADPWLAAGLIVAAAVYLRGWTLLRRRGSAHFSARHLAAFWSGLAVVYLALASPLATFAGLLLEMHMAQHLLLVLIAPPLLWLAQPLLPLELGLPRSATEQIVVPLLGSAPVRAAVRYLTHPVTAWLLAALALWMWHLPSMYELALRSPAWHYAEHASFFATALLFWFPVVQPYPSRPVWPRAALLPYLLLATMQSTALCGLLTFADRVVYAHYEAAPRIWNIAPLVDQALAGAMMWVGGLIAYLAPMAWIGYRLLYEESSFAAAAASPRMAYAGSGAGFAAPAVGRAARGEELGALRPPAGFGPRRAAAQRAGWDLLRVPVVGRFLRERGGRLALRIALAAVALAIVADGWWGPQVAAMNLAGTLPWIHWRGLVVLGLLVGGNFFCLACPFTLPRSLPRRWFSAPWGWPSWLRTKWASVGLLLVFFWAYETWDLWASPWWTAWIAVGYFAAAATVDACFRGASFCKYVCPIGQFQFVLSSVSPLEVRVRDAATCSNCATHECLHGTPDANGCELHLFQPRKAGNLDCTFCLDCVRACPHGNVGVLATLPGVERFDDRPRSGIGRASDRPDLAALVLVLVFAAFANAAGMVAPVASWQRELATATRLSAPVIETMYCLAAFIVLPAALVWGTACASSRLSRDPPGWRSAATRFAGALVPLGFSMWLAHYGFHLATGVWSFVPAAQRFAADRGWQLGVPQWAYNCCSGEVATWLLRLEILALDAGLLGSLYLAYRLAERGHGLGVWAFIPWAVLIVGLFLLGVWLVLQPMEMRGMTTVAASGL